MFRTDYAMVWVPQGTAHKRQQDVTESGRESDHAHDHDKHERGVEGKGGNMMRGV